MPEPISKEKSDRRKIEELWPDCEFVHERIGDYDTTIHRTYVKIPNGSWLFGLLTKWKLIIIYKYSPFEAGVCVKESEVLDRLATVGIEAKLI